MNFKRIVGSVVGVIGIAMICFSVYIKQQVASGEILVSGAQKQVNQASSLFSISPYTKPVGKGLTQSAQKKIDAGSEKINHYKAIAQWLLIGGIVVIVIGAATIVLGKKKPGRRSK